MKARGFTTLFAKLGLLSRPQRLQVLDALRPTAGLDQVVELIDEIRSAERCCPRCASRHWHRHGHANDLQRFRCRECGRTYNDLSGTPLTRLLRIRQQSAAGATPDSLHKIPWARIRVLRC